ncbi:MAG: shikimate kinase, partial [Alistipes sp.]|nr:shikimate kinase [Alistipes sp.]
MKLFLVGYMGCGKSSLGKKLSKVTGYEFVDMDSVIEQREG